MMKDWKHVLLALSGSTVLLIAPGRALVADDQQPEPGKQQPQKLERTIKVTLGYWLYNLQQSGTLQVTVGAEADA